LDSGLSATEEKVSSLETSVDSVKSVLTTAEENISSLESSIDSLEKEVDSKADSDDIDIALNKRLSNLSFKVMTQAQYDALATKDANTMYIIKG
jgi:predicted RNase H-like nuclease (RuvC/YqgF family)